MKYHSNIPKTIKSVVSFRIKVLEHKRQYGIDSAISAFNVSRSTIYHWQKVYRKSYKIKHCKILVLFISGTMPENLSIMANRTL